MPKIQLWKWESTINYEIIKQIAKIIGPTKGPEPMINHRSAPKPETLVEMTGMSMEVANSVRALIKDTSKDEILANGQYPETAKRYSPEIHSDDDLLMMAICECVGGVEVKKIPVQTPTKSYHLHQVVLDNPDRRSIGLNDDWRNFYVRSLNEVLTNVERRHEAENPPAREQNLEAH